jgi:hypothetical protein
MLVGLLAVAGCAAAPEPKGEIKILGHTCDQWGVASMTVVSTGPTVATMRWSNEGVCGTPS